MCVCVDEVFFCERWVISFSYSSLILVNWYHLIISSHLISSYLISSYLYTNSGKEHDTKGHGVPETKGTSEGSAARNIQRKSDHVKGYVHTSDNNNKKEKKLIKNVYQLKREWMKGIKLRKIFLPSNELLMVACSFSFSE